MVGVQYVSVSRGASLLQEGMDDPAVLERGEKTFLEACTGCHDSERVLLQRKSEEAWRKTLDAMISRGAVLPPGEEGFLTAYLTTAYGPDSPLPSTDEPEGSARQILIGVCTQCHPIDLVLESRRSEDDWRATLAMMRDFGANVTPEMEATLVKYLARHFGSR